MKVVVDHGTKYILIEAGEVIWPAMLLDFALLPENDAVQGDLYTEEDRNNPNYGESLDKRTVHVRLSGLSRLDQDREYSYIFLKRHDSSFWLTAEGVFFPECVRTAA